MHRVYLFIHYTFWLTLTKWCQWRGRGKSGIHPRWHFAGGAIWDSKINKRAWDSAGLKMPIHAHFFGGRFLTRKVGQTYLVFDVRSGFSSRSVRARLQVSVCSGLRFVLPWLTSIHTSTHTQTAFWPAYMKVQPAELRKQEISAQWCVTWRHVSHNHHVVGQITRTVALREAQHEHLTRATTEWCLYFVLQHLVDRDLMSVTFVTVF